LYETRSRDFLKITKGSHNNVS